MLGLLVALLLPANAGVFQKKTMHAPWPERQAQMEHVLPKGWMQLQADLDSKTTHGYRDAEGRKLRYDHDVSRTTTRFWLRFDLGFSRRIRMYVHAPWVEARLVNEHGTVLGTRALGDIHSGVVLQPVIGKRWALAGQVDVKAPSGVEWPHNFVGGPTGTDGFLTGTGVTNLGLHGLVRLLPWDGFALKADLAYVLKVPSIVGYVVEKDGFGNGWIDPGDELAAHGSIVHNLVPELALLGDAWVSRRGTYRIGVSGPGVFRTDLAKMPDTDGVFVDLGMGASYQPDAQVELRAWFKSQVLGADTRHFAALGLEEFSPQPGTELGASVAVRW